MRVSFLFLLAACVGCAAETAGPSEETSSTSSQLQNDEDNPNPGVLFAKDSHPYGVSMERWSELSFIRNAETPFDHNPLFDPTGADCAVDQKGGRVWFLSAVPGPALGTNVTRTCTIPRHHAIHLQLASALNTPCPGDKPPPGQTMYEWLIGQLKPLIDAVRNFNVDLDGVPLKDVLSYRATSDDLFYLVGDVSMQVWDSCITGKREPSVSDGYFLMFKPLPPGQHTIVVHGQDMEGTPITLTENLTIE